MINKVNMYKLRSKKYFDKKSTNYFDSFDGKYCKLMYEGVMQKIRTQPFKSILDVGCGTGAILSLVTGEYKDVKACGIDLSEKMLQRAAKLLSPEVQLVAGDSDNLPWPDDSFDLVVCNSSFHHYPEPLKVLKEIRRVLKSDGKVLIADPWWSNPKRFLINLFLDSPFNFGGDVRIYSGREMLRLLKEGGFTCAEWEVIADKFSIALAAAGK